MDTQSSFNYFLFYDKQCFPPGTSGIQFLGIRVRSEFQLFLRDLRNLSTKPQPVASVSASSQVRGNCKGGVRERSKEQSPAVSRAWGLRASPAGHCLLENCG